MLFFVLNICISFWLWVSREPAGFNRTLHSGSESR